MCGGIAIARDGVPDFLAEQLQDRIFTRDGVPEIRFQYRDKVPILPVWKSSEFLLMSWGNRDNKQSRLPRTGWAKLESVEAGKWANLKPELIEIPALFGLEKGIWFHIQEGMKGILVHDEQRSPHVYMLTQPASHYYQVMTRHERMPVFLGEQI
jgi:hypothetical protein